MPLPWRCCDNHDGETHIAPIGDLRQHILSEDCWCEPRNDGDSIIHNSADEREKFETGQRKLS